MLCQRQKIERVGDSDSELMKNIENRQAPDCYFITTIFNSKIIFFPAVASRRRRRHISVCSLRAVDWLRACHTRLSLHCTTDCMLYNSLPA